MDELQPLNQQTATQRYSAQEHCRYCGAPLNPFFYFCTGCGTPYKDIDTVVTPDKPRQLTEAELIRMKAPEVWPLFWTYFAVILGTAFLSIFIFIADEPALAFFVQTGAIFVTTCVFAAMYWRSLVTQFKRIGFGRWQAWAALGLLVPALGVNWLWSSMWHELRGVEPTSFGIEQWASLPMLIFLICVFPAITEEIAFRGLLQHWLATAIRPWRAIVLASILFAALHFSIESLPYLFGLALILGWAKWKTGSLYPSMLIHFLHNLAVVVFMWHS